MLITTINAETAERAETGRAWFPTTINAETAERAEIVSIFSFCDLRGHCVDRRDRQP
jgi:hypothetical protein